MSAFSRPLSSLGISDQIRSPLREVARRQWFVIAAVGMLQTLTFALIALLLGALLLGSFERMPRVLRVPLALATWGAVLWTAFKFLRPALRRWSLSRSAMHVEESLPGMHERLSSAVELGAEGDERFRGSPMLLSHLFFQAEKDANGIKPKELISTSRVTRWGICLAPVLLAWALFSLLHPQPVEAGLFRLFNPMGAPLPATLSKIAVLPGDITIPQGDDLDITAKVSREVSGDSTNHAALFVKYPSGQVDSRSMEMTAPREFAAKLADLQQSFTYMVRTDTIDSAWFSATVNPRPAIVSLDLHYEYPAYTALEEKKIIGSDGTIEAIAGTKVTVTVHAMGALVDSADHKSQLLIDEGKPMQTAVPLTPLVGNDYQAVVIVSHSAQYRVQLCNSYGLTNRDDQPRNIIAHFDQPPTISILSPQASETVRPDDIVPVRYVATDDFGIASIEAIVQADENPPQTHVLHFAVADHRYIKQTYAISVASIIQQSASPNINHITYQLKATDNRDPDPQSSLSAKQTLIIDRNTQSFSEKQDARTARAMNRTLEQAMQQLNEAQQKADSLHNNDPNNPMVDQNRNNAHAAEEKLAEAARELHDQEQQDEGTPFANVAKKADDVANQEIQKAADDAAKAELAADRPEQRIEDANAAQKEINAARQKLDALRNQIEDARKEAQATRDLNQAAKLQAEAAKGFAEHPDQNNVNQDKERQAMAKLQEAINLDPALQNDKARQVAQRLADLANRIAELEKQQTRQQAQTVKQQQLAQVQDKSNKLAEQQKKLNDEVQHFVQKDKTPLDTVHAQPPAADQENNIVAELNRNDLDNAAAQMKQHAAQLQQDAHQLQQQADAHDPQMTPDQQAAQQRDQQNDQQANQEKDQANQAADELAQQAQQPQAPDANNAAEQHVAAAAQAIEQQADALHPNDQKAQQEAQAAHHDAEQAEHDAQAAEHAAKPDEAKHDLNEAAKELHHAAAELARAADNAAKADQAQAKAQDRQEAQEAAQQAKQLAAEQAALAQAAEQERPAVAQARDNAEPVQQAAAEQQQLADQAHQAGQQAAELGQQARQDADADVAHRAQETHDALEQANREQHQAADAEQHADPAHAAEHQEAAQQALAQAEAALRGLQQAEQANADQAHPETPEANNTPGHDHPAADQGHPDAGADQGQADAGQTPEQEEQQAARRAQEAAAVQPQALQSNPQAPAEEAANALEQAAEANAAAQPGQPHPGEPDEGKTTGEEAAHATNLPMPALVSINGISVQQGDATGQPESVRALGISAGDWARLPTLMRNELMNAAQQSGPPTYREMIKNYYVRIAREQAEAGATNAERQ
jgi:hypothetical protein